MENINNFYIHIGYQKSASSYLQEKFFKKHPKINYINVENPGKLSEYLYNTPSNNFKLNYAKQLRDQEILPYLNEKQINILADERFTACWVSPYLVADRLYTLFPNAKILVIIRNQFEILRSLYDMHPYSYFIQRKRWLNFKEWLNDNLENHDKSFLEGIYYNKMLSYYAKLFGRENIKVYLFEELVSLNENTILSLSQFLDVTQEELLNYLNVKPENKASTHALYHFKMKYFPSISFSKFIPRPLIKTVAKLYQSNQKTEIDSESYDKIYKLYQNDNNNLIQNGWVDFHLMEKWKYPLNHSNSTKNNA